MYSAVDLVFTLAYGTSLASILFALPTVLHLHTLTTTGTKHSGEVTSFPYLLLSLAYFVALFIHNVIEDSFSSTSFYFSILGSAFFFYFCLMFHLTGNTHVQKQTYNQAVIFFSIAVGLLATLQIMPHHHQKTTSIASVVSLGFAGNGYPILFIIPKDSVDTLDMIACLNGAMSSLFWYLAGYLTNDHITIFASVINTFLTSYWLYLVIRPMLKKAKNDQSMIKDKKA
eukprot:TRINITY_DN13343_c0_g1_i1.p1 TRINITY_DN13343_c0_g1~~TRINITY_DN13343_c0_g1_i1.p1  ORF type:complete len:228 (-),score=41.67 TRINITY_DN13343_c0_g1_i1:89-772(-)